MKKKILITLCVMTVISLPITAIATSNYRRSNLKSTGTVHYTDGTNEVYISSDDLVYLADEIDNLESLSKEGIATAINELDKHNAVTDVSATINGSYRTYSELFEDIKKSQSIINEGESTYVNTNGSLATDSSAEGVTEIQIHGATAENLSVGTAAWVDGQYIVGTGGDNNSYYTQGVVDGKKEKSNVIHLGGAGTYDIKQYCEDYTSLTTDNFICKSTIHSAGSVFSERMEFAGYWGVEIRDISQTQCIYNSSTGILTVANGSYRLILWRNAYGGATTGEKASRHREITAPIAADVYLVL